MVDVKNSVVDGNPVHQYDFARCPIIKTGWAYKNNSFTWLPGNRYMWDATTITGVNVPYSFPMVSSATVDGSNNFVMWAAEDDILLNWSPKVFTKGEYNVSVAEYAPSGKTNEK